MKSLFPDIMASVQDPKERINSIHHRTYWSGLLKQISDPVLRAGSKRQLKALMPVETAFLTQAVIQERLPGQIKPAQVRCALTTVMQRLMSAPGTFDEQGWLRIGLCGHQESLGEDYISTGSLYLCATVLLPLGLPETHAFWSREYVPWTSVH